MNIIKQWLKTAFPRNRLLPDANDVARTQQLYASTFNTASGHELLELWIEEVVFTNPRSTDPNECIAYAVKCAVIEDIVKAVDKANNPGKYPEPETLRDMWYPTKRRVA